MRQINYLSLLAHFNMNFPFRYYLLMAKHLSSVEKARLSEWKWMASDEVGKEY